MPVSHIRIQNFRSIKDLDIELGPLNALIGPNNAGKSNILRALNTVLGDNWPSERSFGDSDFHNYDKSNGIIIEVTFDVPLASDPTVQGFRLSLTTQGLDYVAIDYNGNVATWGNGKEKRVSNALKDDVPLLYIGLQREAERQIRPTRWTPYGKLLRHLEQRLSPTDRQAFISNVRATFDQYLRPLVKEAEDLLTEFIRKQSGLGIKLEFDLLDPLAVLKSVRPYFFEANLQFDPEEVGAGLQSGLALGIAKAYADIVKQPVVLAIEEPELYLHPHGCRYFYRLIKDLSMNGVQVVYTTHERDFVDLSEYRSVNIVRRSTGYTEVSQGGKLTVPNNQEQQLKLWTKFNPTLNEAFFANVVILVEGFPDAVACRTCLTTADPKLDLDKQGISILECDSIDNMPAIARVLSGFGITTFALIDEDPGNPQTIKNRLALQSLLGGNRVWPQNPNLEGLFGLPRKPTKATSILVFTEYLKTHSPPLVYTQLCNDLKKVMAIL